MTTPEPIFHIGDRICVQERMQPPGDPDVGTVAEVEWSSTTPATWMYRMTWRDSPSDHLWYEEWELRKHD